MASFTQGEPFNICFSWASENFNEWLAFKNKIGMPEVIEHKIIPIRMGFFRVVPIIITEEKIFWQVYSAVPLSEVEDFRKGSSIKVLVVGENFNEYIRSSLVNEDILVFYLDRGRILLDWYEAGMPKVWNRSGESSTDIPKVHVSKDAGI